MKSVALHQNEWGWKFKVSFEYDADLVAAIKELPWKTTHRAWDPDLKSWLLDMNPTSMSGLQDLGFTIPMDVMDRIKKEGLLPTPTITLAGARGFLTNLPRDVEQAIWHSLQFQPAGVEWTKKFQMGLWDGFIKLYKKSNHTFPVGLLKTVIRVIDDSGLDYTIIDNRKKRDTLPIHYQGPPLRDYQNYILRQCLKEKSGTVCLPTGSGKTILALKLMSELNRSTIIIVHRKELLYQWRDEIMANLQFEPGLIGDGHRDEEPITVAMIQSLYKHSPEGDYDVLVVDETHHVPADTFTKVINQLDCYYRFGLSATPWREDGREMQIWAQTGTLLQTSSVEELVEEGFLARPEFKIIQGSVPPDWGDWAEEYAYVIRDPARMRSLVNYTKKLYDQGYKIYIDVQRILHGREVELALQEEEISAIFISGTDDSDTRNSVLHDFKDDRFVLVSTLIKEGVDLPEMNAIILAGGGKSSTKVIQTLGRALRPKPGENKAVIVDIVDHGKYTNEHFRQRQETMRSYYGSLYQRGKTNE